MSNKGPTVMSQKLYGVILAKTKGKYWIEKDSIQCSPDTMNLLMVGGHIQETEDAGVVYISIQGIEPVFNQFEQLGDLVF